MNEPNQMDYGLRLNALQFASALQRSATSALDVGAVFDVDSLIKAAAKIEAYLRDGQTAIDA